MMPRIAKGEISGEIARYGVVVVRQYDMFCLNHSKAGVGLYAPPTLNPVLMKQSITEESDGTTIMGKFCPLCGQSVEEGRYNEKQLAEFHQKGTKIPEKKVFNLDD